MIVLDASAVLELLLITDKGRSVAERIAPREESLHAPHLIDLEVAQVLRRYVTRGQIGEQRAREALDDFRDLDLSRYPHDVLLDRIWELRHNASAYDAAYLSLAETLEAPLLTTDARLARVADTRAVIEVL
ncbi:MAG TPA: type II toxin-antitoxin system VapC family toxin [Myxococcota bacterium]|nr:type II toxin-antitoxin system VapC family toxin [Myxococcota bacterium]